MLGPGLDLRSVSLGKFQMGFFEHVLHGSVIADALAGALAGLFQKEQHETADKSKYAEQVTHTSEPETVDAYPGSAEQSYQHV